MDLSGYQGATWTQTQMQVRCKVFYYDENDNNGNRKDETRHQTDMNEQAGETLMRHSMISWGVRWLKGLNTENESQVLTGIRHRCRDNE